jgi:hypothetical protein
MGNNRNPNLRWVEDEIQYTDDMIKEFIKCSEDIVYFAEKYCYIVSINEGRKVITLRDYQRRMMRAFTEKNPDKPSVILKAGRQSGKTQATIIYALHYILFNKDKNVAILANAEKTALSILGSLRQTYELLPKWLQQPVKEDGWSATKVALENGCKIFASSTASNAARGFTISCVSGDTKITVRNKRTGKIEDIEIENLYGFMKETNNKFKLIE